MDLIKKWLYGSRNYHIGVVLYNNLGTDKNLKELFQGEITDHKKARLQQALQDLLQKPKIVLQPARVNEDTDEMPGSRDPVLEALRQEWLKPYTQMQYLRHQLDKYEGNSKESIEARKPIAFEILELEQQCMVIWERRDHYINNGNLPGVNKKENELPDDPVEMGKLIENTKRNIRRNKKLMKEHPDSAIYPLNLKHWEELLEKINKKLHESKTSE